MSETPRKACYVGAPAIFKLRMECREVFAAIGGYGCYHVGSSLERADWRDVDVRLLMEDGEFYELFPNCKNKGDGAWEIDNRWLLMTTMISDRLAALSGLPVDFQIHPAKFANARYEGRRDCLSM